MCSFLHDDFHDNATAIPGSFLKRRLVEFYIRKLKESNDLLEKVAELKLKEKRRSINLENKISEPHYTFERN